MRTSQGYVVRSHEGAVAELGVARMRVLAPAAATGGSFALTEFAGEEGAWTVPHVHRAMEESFLVLDGEFTFRLGDEVVEAPAGTYVLVPRGTPHAVRAAAGGGRLLTLMVPGGLEEMFFALAGMSPGALTDPSARAAVAASYDSVPVP